MRSLSHINWINLAVGVSLVGLSAAFSNQTLESILGRTPHSLSWGPALFRAMLALHGIVMIGLTLVSDRGAWPERRSPIHRSALITLSVLTVIGLVLRVYQLNTCLWLDEVLTMLDYGRSPFTQILTSFPNQNQHMLYSLMAHSAIAAFGEQAWTLRLPSVFFGIGSIWALYFLGRRIVGENQALVASALMTVSYHHVWFSQNARGYMGLLFFTLVSSSLWMASCETPSRRNLIGYAIVTSFGIWVHMTMLFVVMSQVIITFAPYAVGSKKPASPWRLLAAFVLAGTLTLQEHALALPEFLRSARNEVSMPSEWTSPIWVVAEMARSLQIGFGTGMVLACGALFVIAGWFLVLMRHREFALLAVMPAVIGGGLMLAESHNLWPRFFFFAMGFVLLIVVHGIFELPRIALQLGPVALGRLAGPVAAAVLIVASILTLPRCYALPKQDFTGARDFVESIRQPAESVVTVGLAAHAYRYYAPSWKAIENPAQFDGQFLVYTLDTELKAFHPELWSEVTQQFEPMRAFPGTLGGGEVIVCRRRPAVYHSSTF